MDETAWPTRLAQVPAPMWIGLLGSLQLRVDGAVVAVPAARQRAVLAVLAVRAGELVSTGELAELVWDGMPPEGAAVTIRNYVKRLRLRLGGAGGQIVSCRPGYRLEVAEDELDLRVFTRLCRDGGVAVRAGEWTAAFAALGRGLGLWRGMPFADVGCEWLAREQAPALSELRWQAAEWRAEAGLALGRHAELVGELAGWCAAEPLRERFAALRMLALYRCGRQGEALAVYLQARRVLVDELGVEPGEELRRLHQQILACDPALAASAAPVERGTAPRLAASASEPGGPGVVPRQPPTAVSDRSPMAEQTAASAADAATGQDVLLATKLFVPRPPADLVARPRLAEALSKGLAGALILVSAPAGFGKTALLADWILGDGRSAGWLSLDASDNDPARFWRHAAAALDLVCPGIGERVGHLLGPPSPPSFEGPVTALINELAGRPDDDEVLLVLDDYHLIEAGPVHASVGFLLEHRPPGLHVVLASRSDPPLPLARLRARGQLTELRAADLRFTTDEATALLRRAASADLPGELVAALAGRTEGWAVGLQLVALSLRGHHDASGFVASFSGSHRYILDYLAEEVLDRQPEHLRAFLLETSVLERLSGELCDAVTGRTGGQAVLEAIERAGLFLTPLDEVRGWWRYHPLFADLLCARLQRDQPGMLPKLHRAAGAWFEGRGLVHEAIAHALVASEAAWAASMIERNFDALLEAAEGAMVDRWVAAMPAELVRSRPRLLLAQAIYVILSGRLAQAERLIADAERALESGGDEPGEPAESSASLLANVPALIPLLRAGVARRRGDSERMDALVQQARAHLYADDEALRPLVGLYLAVADQLRGRTTKAERSLAGAVADQHTAGGRYLAVSIACDLGKVRQAQGDLDGAQRAYEQALEIVTDAGLPLPLTGMAYLGMAEVLYERDNLAAAARHATDGIALCRHLAETQPLATGLARLAWIRQAQGDHAGALEAIGEAQQLAPVLGAAGLLNPVPAQRARLQLACGDVAAAAHWACQYGVTVGDEPDYRTEPEHLVLARILLAQDRPDAALALLERWLTAAVAAGRTASTIQIYTLLALAQAAIGDRASALRTLATALALAHPRGYVRVFADEGAPMAALLGQLAAAQRAGQAEASGVPADCLALVREAVGPESAAGLIP